MNPAVPQGYVPLDITSEHIRSIGGFWRKPEGNQLLVGLRVQPQQVNSNGSAHGGLIATLADVAMSAAIMHGAELGPPSTINLSLDFAGAVSVGQWLEARSDIYRRTRRMAFAHCLITADGVVVVRASGVFKLQRIDAG